MWTEMNGEKMSSHSYYKVLGLNAGSSDEEIRRAYRKLAMQWHPDKWTRTPSLLGEAKRKFQQIQEAYSVLSDKRKRTMYDAGLYELVEEEEVEGFSDFLQEMMSMMTEVRREEKNYSMEELQSMFMEMAKGFEFPEWSYPSNECQWPSSSSSYEPPQWSCGPWLFDEFGSSEKAQSQHTKWASGKSSHLHTSGFGMYGPNYFCI